jgi:hypothetical protein
LQEWEVDSTTSGWEDKGPLRVQHRLVVIVLAYPHSVVCAAARAVVLCLLIL